LYWFGEVVSEHVICWAVFDRNFACTNSVFDKKVSHIDMFGSLAA
jgi:hypothetical protein